MADNIKNDLIRALRSPRMTFQNGVMNTPNNNVNGFISDLVNSEVEKTGSIIRRKGSFCLINPDEYKEWALYFPIDISGAEVIILVDYSGRFYVVSDLYPEILFTLNKSGFTKIYYPDTNAYSFEVRFDRGTSYILNDRTDSATVWNEYGDSITIFKRGSIRFLDTTDVDESKTTESRRDFDTIPDTAGVYVPIKYTRKKTIKTFRLVDAPKKTYDYVRKNIPRINSIRGDICVAQVDSMGRIGKKSSSVFLNKYGEYFVSMIPAFNFEDEIVESLGLFPFGTPSIPSSSGFSNWFAEREAAERDTLYLYNTGAGDAEITFVAKEGITNATITLVENAAPDASAMTVAVVGNAVTVTWGASHVPNYTVADIQTAIAASVAASLVMSTILGGDGSSDATALAVQSLTSYSDMDLYRISCEEQPYNFQDEAFTEDPAFTNTQFLTCTFGIHPDTEKKPLGKYMKATMWLDYQAVSTAADRVVDFTNVGALMRIVRASFMKTPRTATALSANREIICGAGGNINEFLSAGDADSAAATMTVGLFDEVQFFELPMFITKAKYMSDIPHKYGFDDHYDANAYAMTYSLYDSSADGQEPVAKPGILYEVLIGLPSNYIKDVFASIALYDVNGDLLSDQEIRSEGFTSLMTAQVQFIIDEAGEGDPSGFYPAQWAFRVPDNTNNLVGLRNTGYDCWEVERNLKINDALEFDSDYYDVDLDGNISVKMDEDDKTVTDRLMRNHDLYVYQTDYDDWFKNGSRFAVINDTAVLAVSQRAFAKSDADSGLIPIYSLDLIDSGQRRVNYANNKIDMIGYLPVCALENINLRAFAHNASSLQKEAEYIKDMAENRGSVFLLENGSLWIGKNNEMLLFDFVVNLNSSITAIEKFNEGVAAFSANNVSYIDSRGNVYPVQNLSEFKSTNVVKAKWMPDGRVYAVTSEGEIMVVSVQYTENNNQYYQADNVSLVIPETMFGSNTDITFSKGTVWFSRDTDVWGLTKGKWTKINTFGDNQIAGIFTYRDELCVIFNNNPIPAGRTKTELLGEVVG